MSTLATVTGMEPLIENPNPSLCFDNAIDRGLDQLCSAENALRGPWNEEYDHVCTLSSNLPVI